MIRKAIKNKNFLLKIKINKNGAFTLPNTTRFMRTHVQLTIWSHGVGN